MEFGPFRDDLMTQVNRLEYDFRTKVGVLYLPPLSCTDMTGAIELFIALDPEVTKIETVAGDGREDVYAYVRRDGKWIAVPR